MPQLGKNYLMQFGKQGMIAHPNSWLSSPDEVVVAENACFENDLLQKEPAAPEYDTTGVAVEGPSGTLSSAADIVQVGRWFPAATSVAVVGTLFTGVASQTSPWTFTLTGNASAGQFVALSIGQTLNPTDNPVATAVSDSKGNTWVRAGHQSGSGTVTGDIDLWVSLLTTGLTSGVDTFTITFTTAGADNRTAVAVAYNGVTSTTSQASADNALDTSSAWGPNPYPGFVGTSYPAYLIAAIEFPRINTVTPTWTGGFAETAR